jgi:isocitrate dehydrogenase kinase/phosphatase
MPSTAHGSRISLNQATPDSPAPETVARTIREGFDRHYSLFRAYCAEARNCFEHADWRKLAEIALERELGTASRNAQAWPKIKRAYIGQLMDHLQADCAETFYNSVACRVLKREYYNNENIFWRPALSTEHLQGSQPAYRSYYPRSEGLRRCLLSMLTRPRLANRFENLRRDVRRLERAIVEARPKRWVRESNNQVQVLNSLFFRNKAAYLVGRSINGDAVDPFVIPLLQNDDGSIYVDTLITRTKDAAILFSFARAYFFVDMEVPSAYVSFLQAFMPGKSVVDLYSILGLQKQAKTLFYRELQFHLSHSRDNFKIAPGVPGMVMLVFYLPSLDFVFKVIRDRFEAPKDITRDGVREKYLLVKLHDRVGRMADTLEYSKVAIPVGRIDSDLLQQLQSQASRNIEFEGDMLILKHVYIERRMEPLDQYLAQATGGLRKRAIRDYGQAIRDMVSTNIFPGDMFKKNFGVTRTRRVVFYDYDEVGYVTDCNFRRIPPARTYEEELAPTAWYSVGPNDVFPESFGPYFFGNEGDFGYFEKYHGDLVNPAWWQDQQKDLLKGCQADIFPYGQEIRFRRRFG